MALKLSLSPLIWIIYLSFKFSKSDILWYYPMNASIPSEWVQSGYQSGITSVVNVDCPQNTINCWQGMSNLKQQDWALTFTTQNTIHYENIVFSYQLSTSLSTDTSCIIEYTTNSGINWYPIQYITALDIDIANSFQNWIPSANDNSNGIIIRIQSTTTTNTHGLRICRFNEFILTADKITTTTPTLNPTRAPYTVTSNPTQSTQPTKNPSQLPTKNPSQFPTQNPSQLPTINPSQIPSQNPRQITQNPTHIPQIVTSNPTQFPSELPTKNPTHFPTQITSKNPTNSPTPIPSKIPTYFPTQHKPFIGTIRIETMENPAELPTTRTTEMIVEQKVKDTSFANIKNKKSLQFTLIIVFISLLFIAICITIPIYVRRYRARKQSKQNDINEDGIINMELATMVFNDSDIWANPLHKRKSAMGHELDTNTGELIVKVDSEDEDENENETGATHNGFVHRKAQNTLNLRGSMLNAVNAKALPMSPIREEGFMIGSPVSLASCDHDGIGSLLYEPGKDAITAGADGEFAE